MSTVKDSEHTVGLWKIHCETKEVCLRDDWTVNNVDCELKRKIKQISSWSLTARMRKQVEGRSLELKQHDEGTHICHITLTKEKDKK